VAKAYALGANFVMLGRPVLYALGARGSTGLRELLQCFNEDISTVLAQLGLNAVSKLGSHNLASPLPTTDYPAPEPVPHTVRLADKNYANS
ncbi:MAG: alpha-hydroxy-acid oxidizing protein, partial [Pseudomonadota bacterium]